MIYQTTVEKSSNITMNIKKNKPSSLPREINITHLINVIFEKLKWNHLVTYCWVCNMKNNKILNMFLHSLSSKQKLIPVLNKKEYQNTIFHKISFTTMKSSIIWQFFIFHISVTYLKTRQWCLILFIQHLYQYCIQSKKS